jgi:hypothetical protein
VRATEGSLVLYDTKFMQNELRALRKFSILLPNGPTDFEGHVIHPEHVSIAANTNGPTHNRPLGGLRHTDWIAALANVAGGGGPGAVAAAAAANGVYRVTLDRRTVTPSPTHQSGIHDARNAIVLSFTAAPNGFDAYFLPWDGRGGAVHMTIPAGGGGPRHFFTAALSGCSVMVDGPPNNPTVYHCGVDDWENTSYVQPPHSHQKPTQATSPQLWQDLVEHLAGGAYAAGIDKTDYIEDGAVGTARARAIEPLARQAKDDQAALALPWGAVFGLRDAANNWSFYLQENVTFLWQKTKHHIRGPQGWFSTSQTSLKEARPMQVTRFFPAGGPVLGRLWNF